MNKARPASLALNAVTPCMALSFLLRAHIVLTPLLIGALIKTIPHAKPKYCVAIISSGAGFA
jgi:hypothetical protein